MSCNSDLIEKLRSAANPDLRNAADSGYKAANELRAVAQVVGDQLLEAEALLWEVTYLRLLGRYSQVFQRASELTPLLKELDDSPEKLKLEESFLWLYIFACADGGQFSLGLLAAKRMEEIAVIRDDPKFWVREKLAKAILFDRMGNSLYGRKIVLACRQDYIDSVGELPAANLDNALLAIGLSHHNRMLGFMSKREADAHLAILEKEGLSALERETDSQLGLATIHTNLSELYIFMRRLEDSQKSLDTAMEYFEGRKTTALKDWVNVNYGKWYLATHEPQKALEMVEPMYRRLEYDDQLNGLRARRVAAQAAQDLGDHEAAFTHMKRLEIAERKRTTAQLQVQSEIFMNRIYAEAEADRHRRLAETDPLTKLGNRRRLHRAFNDLIPDSDVRDSTFSVAILDIDHFKSINDRFGHGAGDSVLVHIADLLIEYTRASDIVIRLGGEEFMIIFPGSKVEAAAKACEKLRSVVAATHFSSLPKDWELTMSIGVASAPPHDGVRLIAIADHAMYQAKRAGRNKVVIGDEDAALRGNPTEVLTPNSTSAASLINAYVDGKVEATDTSGSDT